MITIISFLILSIYLVLVSAAGYIIGKIIFGYLAKYFNLSSNSDDIPDAPEKIICLDLSSNKILSHRGFGESEEDYECSGTAFSPDDFGSGSGKDVDWFES